MNDEKLSKLEWFLPDPKQEEALGPYSTELIRSFVADKRLQIDSFVCCPALKREWVRIYEFDFFDEFLLKAPVCPLPKTFSKGIYDEDSLSEDMLSSDGLRDLLGMRVPLRGDLLLHNNRIFMKGIATELGPLELTACFDEKEFLFEEGEEIWLTMFNASRMDSFSAKVVEVKRESKGQKIYVDLFLLRLNPEHKRSIIGYVRSHWQKEHAL